MSEPKAVRWHDRTRPVAGLPYKDVSAPGKPALNRARQAANDDHTAWDLLPFPDDWYAGC
jgi:hypothetical protein